jgi:hypothetical protein
MHAVEDDERGRVGVLERRIQPGADGTGAGGVAEVFDGHSVVDCPAEVLRHRLVGYEFQHGGRLQVETELRPEDGGKNDEDEQGETGAEERVNPAWPG